MRDDSYRLKQYLIREVEKMQIGECVCIDNYAASEAFPCGFPTIYENTVQALLSSLPGSGCGAFRATQDPINGNITVSRHEESNDRYYVDPDRSHLYEKTSKGTLRLKSEYKS